MGSLRSGHERQSERPQRSTGFATRVVRGGMGADLPIVHSVFFFSCQTKHHHGKILDNPYHAFLIQELKESVTGKTLKKNHSAHGHAGESGHRVYNNISEPHIRMLAETTNNSAVLLSKLQLVQKFYEDERQRLNNQCADRCTELHELLQKAARVRTVTDEEIQLKQQHIRDKFEQSALKKLSVVIHRITMQLQHEHLRRRKRRNLPREAANILNEWYTSHEDNPYPNEIEKRDLAQRTDLKVTQVATWFVNARARKPKPAQFAAITYPNSPSITTAVPRVDGVPMNEYSMDT